MENGQAAGNNEEEGWVRRCVKKTAKVILVLLAVIGLGLEGFSSLVEFGRILKHDSGLWIAIINIVIPCFGVLISGFSFCLAAIEAKARFDCRTFSFRTRNPPDDTPGGNYWISWFHVMGLTFWVTHLVLAIIDLIWMVKYQHKDADHFPGAGFSEYILLVCIAELSQSIFAFKPDSERVYCLRRGEKQYILAHVINMGGCKVIIPATAPAPQQEEIIPAAAQQGKEE